MSDLDELRREVADLRQQLRQQQDRAGMEAGLRAAQDRDLSAMANALAAQRHLIQALAITQSDHTSALAEHTTMLAEHTRMLTGLQQGVQQIIGMLARLLEEPQ